MSSGGAVSVLGRWIVVAAAVFVLLPGEATAQRTPAGSGKAFVAEATGGTVGSLAGVALGLVVSRADECDVEDLACTISALGVAGIGGVIGSTAGVIIAGRSVNSRPSGIGAFVGAVGGAVAGAGLVHLLTEEVNVRLEKPGVLLVFTVTQGVTAALGSRFGASIRGR